MTKVKGLNLCNATCGVGRRMAKTVAPEKVSRLDREFLENGSKKLTKLFAAIFFLFLLGVGNVWGDATCTLSNSNIVAGTTAATGYGSKSATDGCGKTWNAYALKNYHSNATSDYHYLQIKAYGSNTAYYIQVPEMPGTIKSIAMVVSGASQPIGGGGNSATIYFSSSNNSSTAASGLSANPKTAVSGTGTSSVTLNCEDLGLSSGYITAGGAVRIWGDIVVTYTTGTSYTLTFKEWDGGGTASGSPSTGSVSANATSFSFGATEPSKTGHTIEGFYTNTSASSGVKVANSSRNFVASVTDWTNGSSQYTKGTDANLYIKWSPKVCAITLDKGTSGTADGSVSYTYGNSTMTGEISHATKTGYHLDGYYTAASSGTKILNADGTLAGNNISVSTTTYTSGGNWAYDGTSLTLYAQWTIDNYTIHWKVNGNDWEGVSHGSPSTDANYNTKPATIPTAPVSGDCDGTKVFVGWTNSTYSHASDAPTILFSSQASAPAITGNTTFHAVFANRSGGAVTWNQVAKLSDITAGTYVIENDGYALPSTPTTSDSPLKNASYYLTISDGVITSTVRDSMKWYLTVGTKDTLKNMLGDYLYVSGNDNKNIRVGSTKDGWTFSVNSSAPDFAMCDGIQSRYCATYSSGSDWRSYTSATQANYGNSGKIHLFKLTGGYTYSNYATTCVTCDEPESLTNGANTASSQTVSWTDIEDADGGYIVAYAKDYSTDPGNAVYSASDDDHYTFINVSSGTKTTNIPCNSAGTYYWWVRSRCSTSDNSSCSDWVEGDSWTMNTIYLNTNYEWNAGGAVFAVHYWNDAVTPVTGWSKLMTEVSGCYEGIYTCVIPSGYNNINFGRFSTSQVTDPTDWTYRWNQTSDLTIPTSPAKDYFTLSSKVDANNYNGSWSNYAPYYTISFNNNAAFSTTSAPSSQCVLEGAKASSPTSPKAMGKTVSGWYKEVGCSNKWDFSTQTVSAAQTLYAAWEDVATKTIYLDCSKELSGSKEWDADNVVLFAHAYINGTSLYTDVKATSAINSCDNHVYAFEIPGNADYVTFARCATGASSIVWDGVSANVYNQFSLAVEASKDWYKVSDWTAGSLESTAFAATSYTISFAANSGTGTMSADEVECDDNYTIKTNAYTRGCYAFTGWKANVDVTISDATVTAGTLITAGSTIQGIKSDITLTAQWSQYSCTVTLDKNGATTGSNQTVSATCGSSMPLTTTLSAAIAIPSKTGYTFLGYWDAKSDGNQYYEYDGSTLSSHADWDKETNTAQTLYARWEAKVDHFIDDMHKTTGYTGDGHSESGAGYTVPGPLSDVASGNECETSHYIFVGWILEAGQNEDGSIGTSSNTIYRAGETLNATNATYYAVWAEE